MSTKTLHSDERVQAYLLQQGVREDALLQRLRAEPSAMERGQMQISADAGEEPYPADQDAPTLGVRAFNALVHADARVDMVLLPMSDGITLGRRR